MTETIDWEALYVAADKLRDQFKSLNIDWFRDDLKNDGPRDCTPWNILAETVINHYHPNKK